MFYAKKKAFLSIIFLCLLASIFNFGFGYLNHLSKMNQVSLFLIDLDDEFKKEIKVINAYRCLLLNNKNEDFRVDGIAVKVQSNGQTTSLFYDDQTLEIILKDGFIYDYISQ